MYIICCCRAFDSFSGCRKRTFFLQRNTKKREPTKQMNEPTMTAMISSLWYCRSWRNRDKRATCVDTISKSHRNNHNPIVSLSIYLSFCFCVKRRTNVEVSVKDRSVRNKSRISCELSKLFWKFPFGKRRSRGSCRTVCALFITKFAFFRSSFEYSNSNLCVEFERERKKNRSI